MRVLVLGGYGMLGHKVYQVFRDHFDVYATVRRASGSHAPSAFFDVDRLIEGVDVLDVHAIEEVIKRLRPDVVVNCVGIIKQLREAQDPVASIATNSLLPHQLSALCRDAGCRLIHISTDCVFSGNRGAYTELDNPDPTDLYGRTKWLGELSDDSHALTVRTSIIGRELSGAHALVEWFLSQTGPTVPGFTNAIFSGLPTISLARLLVRVLQDHPDLHGLYHVSAAPISKCHLLELIREAYGLPLEVVPSPDLHIDRSLNSERFKAATGYAQPPWAELVHEMASDATPYAAIRGTAR